MESVEDLVRRGIITDIAPEKAVRNLVKALGKGVLKVMSKMGISTVASYRGAQVFEAIGLSQDVVDACFTGTTSRLGGVGLDVIAEEVARRHAVAYPPNGISPAHRRLDVGGEYQWRREGEPHLFDPETVFRLQHATREGRYDVFKQYTARVNDQAERLMTLRGLFAFKEGVREPISIDEVEPVSEIVKRFSTGAMSYGSISGEAHETLAIAMNRLGAKSNTGEGGEDAERFEPAARTATPSALRSSRSRPGASVSRASTSSTPTTCRSRWRRVPSPARAASCPATRSTRGSPRRVTPPLASASSRRRRTTTSTRSRTSPS